MIKSVVLNGVNCQLTTVSSEKRYLQPTDSLPYRYGIRHADDDLDYPVEIRRDYVLANNWGVLLSDQDLIPAEQNSRLLTDDEVLLLWQATEEET